MLEVFALCGFGRDLQSLSRWSPDLLDLGRIEHGLRIQERTFGRRFYHSRLNSLRALSLLIFSLTLDFKAYLYTANPRAVHVPQILDIRRHLRHAVHSETFEYILL